MKGNLTRTVLLYTRVSTDDQAQGGSLAYQKEFLERFCKLKGYNVVGHYADDFSAKTFNRPAIQEMMKYCKQHKGNVDLVLCTRWDRYSRNLQNALNNMEYFTKLGIEVNSAENWVDLSTPDGIVMLALYCSTPEAENSKISKRTRECNYHAQSQGRCTNKAPKGYVNKKLDDHTKWVEIDTAKASIIREIFAEVAKGMQTPNSIRQQFERKLGKMNKTAFMSMLRNRFYIGEIRVNAYNGEPEKYVKGLHEAIIEREVFYAVQDVIDGRKKNYPKVSKKFHPDLFLRNHLLCPICGKAITGSRSKGNGGEYFYYHCSTYSHFSYRADKVNMAFAKYIGQLTPNKSILALYKEVLRDLNGERNAAIQKEVESLRVELSRIESRLNAAQDKYMDGELGKQDYGAMRERFSKERSALSDRIELHENPEHGSLEPKFDYAISLISNLSRYMADCPVEVKCKLIGLMFPERITFDGKTYQTERYNSVLDLIYLQTNTLRGNEKAENLENHEVSASVPGAGFGVSKHRQLSQISDD